MSAPMTTNSRQSADKGTLTLLPSPTIEMSDQLRCEAPISTGEIARLHTPIWVICEHVCGYNWSVIRRARGG